MIGKYDDTGSARYASGPAPELPAIKSATRGSVVDVSHKLGTVLQECPQWLIAAPRDQLPEPERLAFTPPPRGAGMSSSHISSRIHYVTCSISFR